MYTQLCRMASPSMACVAGNIPPRERIVGKTLRLSGGICTTTKRAAARSGPIPLINVRKASRPPADAPITIISCVGIVGSFLATARTAAWNRATPLCHVCSSARVCQEAHHVSASGNGLPIDYCGESECAVKVFGQGDDGGLCGV